MQRSGDHCRWTAPKLVELSHVDQAENGSAPAGIENGSYNPSGDA